MFDHAAQRPIALGQAAELELGAGCRKCLVDRPGRKEPREVTPPGEFGSVGVRQGRRDPDEKVRREPVELEGILDPARSRDRCSSAASSRLSR